MAFNNENMQLALDAANRYGIDPTLFLRQMNQEGGFVDHPPNSAGAAGPAQFTADTAASVAAQRGQDSFDVHDPAQAYDNAAWLMSQYTQQYGPTGALIAYNAGPGALTSGEPLPAETQQYIQSITGNAQMTGPNDPNAPGGGFNPNTFDPTDPLTAAGLKFNTTGLPTGFVRGPDGRTYYLDNNGQFQPASSQMVANAQIQEKLQVPTAKSGPQATIDQRTGEELIVDPSTGQVTHTGQQVGFGQIDPRELQNAAEQEKQTAYGLQGRQQDITSADALRTAELAAAQEQANISNENANRVQQAQLAQNSEQGANFRTMAGLAPAMENASINAAKEEADILSNPSDVVARMFQSRGGTSPLGFVSQADEINSLRNNLAAIGGLTSGVPNGAGVMPIAPQATYTPPSMGAPLPPAPAYNPYQFTQPPAIPPANAGPAAGAVAGGQSGFQFPTSPALKPAAPLTLTGQGNPLEQDTAGNVSFTVPPRMTTMANPWAVPNDQGGFSGADTAPYGPAGGNMPGTQQQSTPAPMSQLPYDTGGYPGSQGAGFARGTGFTRDRKMVIGDSLDSKPNPEVVSNPTGAPIAIHSPRFGPVQVPPEYCMGTYGMGTYGIGTYATGTDGGNPFAGFNAMAGEQASQGISPFSGFPGNQQTETYPTISGPVGGGFGSSTTSGNPWDGLMNASQGMAGTQSGANLGYMGAASKELASGTINQTDYDRLQYQLANGGSTAGFDPNYIANPSQVSQSDIVNAAIQSSPPAVQALMNGQMPPGYQALTSTDGSGATMPIFTSRELSSLNGDELQALGARTSAQFNAGLPYLQEQAKLNYGTPAGVGPSGNFYMPRGFLAQGMGGFIGI